MLRKRIACRENPNIPDSGTGKIRNTQQYRDTNVQNVFLTGSGVQDKSSLALLLSVLGIDILYIWIFFELRVSPS